MLLQNPPGKETKSDWKQNKGWKQTDKLPEMLQTFQNMSMHIPSMVWIQKPGVSGSQSALCDNSSLAGVNATHNVVGGWYGDGRVQFDDGFSVRLGLVQRLPHQETHEGSISFQNGHQEILPEVSSV